jgi:hypothetical protein
MLPDCKSIIMSVGIDKIWEQTEKQEQGGHGSGSLRHWRRSGSGSGSNHSNKTKWE